MRLLPTLLVSLLALGLTGALSAKPVQPAGGPAATTLRMAPSTTTTPTTAPAVSGEVQYDTTTSPLPANVTSLGFEATGTSEFGDLVRLAGATHIVDRVTVTMSNWSSRANHPTLPAAGYSHPVTLKLYNVDRSTGTPRTGSAIATITQTFTIPWVPAGSAYPGIAFNITFDLGSLGLALPQDVIVSVGFNTRTSGVAPLGVAGPYDALNVGVTDLLPTAGQDIETDSIFWKTTYASNYSDGGAGGVNVFRRDTGWTPYRPAIQITTGSAYATLSATAAVLQTISSSDRKHAASILEARILIGLSLSSLLWTDGNHIHPLLGEILFTFLAEAADELNDVATSRDAAAARALVVVQSLTNVAEQIAAIALADAIAGRGDTRWITRAQADITEGRSQESRGKYGKAIEAYADAWRDAQRAR